MGFKCLQPAYAEEKYLVPTSNDPREVLAGAYVDIRYSKRYAIPPTTRDALASGLVYEEVVIVNGVPNGFPTHFQMESKAGRIVPSNLNIQPTMPKTLDDRTQQLFNLLPRHIRAVMGIK